MDNKNIIIFIIGLLLVLAGLIGFNYSKSRLNIIYEDVNIETENTENDGVNEAEINGVNTEQKEETVKEETKTSKKVSKNNFVTSHKISNNIKQNEERTPVLSETVVKDNEVEDPYVDSDGSVVVRNEFKPNIREKIPYRGVVYTIKTKFAETSKN